MDDTEMEIFPTGRWSLHLHWTLSKDVGVKGPGEEVLGYIDLAGDLLCLGPWDYHHRGGGQWTCAPFICQYIEIGNGDGWQITMEYSNEEESPVLAVIARLGIKTFEEYLRQALDSKPWDEHLFTKKSERDYRDLSSSKVYAASGSEPGKESPNMSARSSWDGSRRIGATISGEVKPDHGVEPSKCRWWEQLFKPSGLSHTATPATWGLDAAEIELHYARSLRQRRTEMKGGRRCGTGLELINQHRHSGLLSAFYASRRRFSCLLADTRPFPIQFNCIHFHARSRDELGVPGIRNTGCLEWKPEIMNMHSMGVGSTGIGPALRSQIDNREYIMAGGEPRAALFERLFTNDESETTKVEEPYSCFVPSLAFTESHLSTGGKCMNLIAVLEHKISPNGCRSSRWGITTSGIKVNACKGGPTNAVPEGTNLVGFSGARKAKLLGLEGQEYSTKFNQDE
ncbi:hypothetical protein DFH09DRAFT_1103036 [Mycena vulgaris]|nr:hypothetical protein DFH09DRAFT_1103036 [Mycena vulgaris]